MSPARRWIRAYTLVELLVVVAIGALLLGVSVPAFVRIVGTGSDEAQNGGRELFTVLRAARQYATTYRVPCAVVYSTTVAVQDSATNDCARVGDVYAMARGFTDREIEDYADITPDDRYSVFTPLDDAAGAFRSFPGVAALENLYFPLDSGACEPDLAFGSPPASYLADRGMVFIRLAEVEEGLLEPIDQLLKFDVQSEYPAHVFLPTGEMLTSDATRERFQLEVGRRPDAVVTKRFIEPSGPYVDTNRMAPVVIDIYRGTGRTSMR